MYPLYALLFADSGLSEARISALFVIWSAVSVLTEIPTGALADRYSRRAALVASGLLQAAGYVLWISGAGFLGFGVGFALWGLGGSLASGALEALLYDEFVAAGAGEHYPTVAGVVTAAQLITQVPVAVAATALFALGGFALAGWISVGSCIAAALLATRLPETRRTRTGEPVGYVETLRSGLHEVARRAGVRGSVIVVAALAALDAAEEYFALLARGWGVPDGWIPLALCGIPLAGAAGAAVGGALREPRPVLLGLLLGSGAVLLVLADIGRSPIGILGVAGYYVVYRLALVAGEVLMQRRIDGPARATIASVAGMGGEVASIAFFGVWALGRLTGMIAAVAAVALLVIVLLGRGGRRCD